MQPEPQIVTADLSEIVTGLFIIVAIASGIRNFLKERGNAQQMQHMRKRQKQDRKLAKNDELSQFLDEVGSSRKPSAAPKKKRPSQRQQADKRRKQRRTRDTRQAQKPQDTRRSRKSQAESSRVGNRQLSTENLSSVREHHLESKVRDRHLESEVADQHLFEDDVTPLQQSSGRQQEMHPVAALLSEPVGIRNAILLNEILQPPLSRRKH